MNPRLNLMFFSATLLFWLLSVFYPTPVEAAPAHKPAASFEIGKESLQQKIDALQNRQGLDDAVKAQLLKFYQSALDNLGNLETFNVRAADFKLAIKEAPDKTKKLQKDIEQLQTRTAKQKPEDFQHVTTEALQQRWVVEKEKISSLNEQLQKQENELALQQARPALIRQETVSAQQERDATQKKLETPPATASKLETEAQQMYFKTLLEARTAELKMLDVEAISHATRVEWLKAQYQLLELQKNALAPVVTAIENILAERRQQEAQSAQDALSQAEKELAGKHAVIQAMTRQNIDYSRDLQTVSENIERYNAQKVRIDAEAANIDEDFKNAEKMINLAGLSPTLGKMLREQRRYLLTQVQQTLASETVQDDTALASLGQFKVEDRLKKLADLDGELQLVMDTQVSRKLPTSQRAAIQAELRVLLQNQKDLLDKLNPAYTTYLRTLGDFDFARQQTHIQASKFADYLDQRLLWVRSSPPVDLEFIPDLYHAVQWLVSPLNGMQAAKDTLKSFAKMPFLAFVALASVAALLALRRRLLQQLADIAGKVNRLASDHFSCTLQALACNLLLVLPIPLCCYYEGWFLTSSLHADNFSKAIGAGLQGIAMPLFFMQFFHRLFAPYGIAEQHFQWRADTAQLLRRQIAWLRWVAIPAVLIINSTSVSKTYAHGDSLGRLALIVSMAAMAVFFRHILEPKSVLLRHAIQTHPNGWLARFRYAWLPVVLILPTVIVGFAVAGYYLSALELQQKLIVTLRLMFIAIMIHALVFRWLTLVNRQLAVANARKKRRAAAHPEKHHHAAGGEDVALPVDEQLIDIPKLNAQTLNLLNVFIGLGLIVGVSVVWKNILPAFSFLENIVLWQHQVTANNQEISEPITLSNLLLAGLYVFITVVSMRNFSGIMELLVFRRWSVETGARYAVNQLAKYGLFSVGFITVSNELGGSWSQVQWLVAALGVGLGFGLQEIFANLVSGIILLFERPIRVGDTVTIGDISGKVSRIQMRATTITDWDQKELVVPNKTFITNQLVNWTLSDSVTRVVITIGIAYGSDIEQAHKIMLETVQATPLVLAEPKPYVYLLNFGDSALLFNVYVYVSELAHRFEVTHALHVRLVEAMHANGIEIPLPQHDIHIRTSEPKLV